MFISQEKRILFFHIPKTAGNSIQKFLSSKSSYIPLFKRLINLHLKMAKKDSYYTPHNLLTEYHPSKLSFFHMDQKYANVLFKELSLDFSHYYEFVIVRNPYDRVSSQYLYDKNKNTLSKYYKNDNYTLTDYLNEYQFYLDSGEENYWFKSQLKWIEKPITGNIEIFKYENLLECQDKLQDIFNDKTTVLTHENVNPSVRDNIWSTQQKQRCYQLFKEEFDALGYDK